MPEAALSGALLHSSEHRLSLRRVASFVLNSSQSKALHKVLAPDLVLIQGPPGTGKSLVATASVSAWAQGDERILVSCHSNQAVNTLTYKLVDNLPQNLQNLLCSYVSGLARKELEQADVDRFGMCLFPDAARAA